MRFGWLAAAAASVCASQAGAQTWIEYEVSGTGTEMIQSGAVYPNGYSAIGDLSLFFTAEVDPTNTNGFGVSDPNGIYSTQGNVFTLLGGLNGTTTVNAAMPGVLTLGNSAIPYRGTAYSATINYGGSNAGFPTTPGSVPASGTMMLSINSPYGGVSYSGTVSRFSVVGPVSDFISPFVTFLPEPATWAMMILGMAAIGFGMRRRSAATAATSRWA